MSVSIARNVCLCLSATAIAALAELPPREALGRTDKYRILVDKVMSGANKWVFTADHMKEAKAAGFNVICRRSIDRPAGSGISTAILARR